MKRLWAAALRLLAVCPCVCVVVGPLVTPQAAAQVAPPSTSPASATLSSSSAIPKTYSLIGARIVKADGELYEGLAVVIDDGRIQRVELASAPGLPAPVRLPPGSVLSPGFIDLCSSLSANNQNFELATAVDAEAGAYDAADPTSAQLERALAAGVTATLIWPAPVNIVSGRACVARTHVEDSELNFLRLDGPLVFSLGSQVLRMDREPTSRSRALTLLQASLRDGAQTSPALREYVQGRIPGLFVGGDVVDVESALAVFTGSLPLPVFVLNLDVRSTDERLRLGRELAAQKAIAILGPYSFETPENLARLAGEWERAGVKVALSGGWPVRAPTSLRQSAGFAVQQGLSVAAARRALTVNAAVACGLAHRIGAIGSGLDADLVVWSGDPLRLDSEVLEVYSRGIRVVRRESLRSPKLGGQGVAEKRVIDEF